MEAFDPTTDTPIIRDTANKYGVPHEELYGLMAQESNFNPDVWSHDKEGNKVAYGLTQLLPSTAQQMGVDINTKSGQIEGGTKYLRQQYDKFQDWDLAHAAYNAGPGAVQKAIEKAGSSDWDKVAPFLPTETQNHIQKIRGFSKEFYDSHKDNPDWYPSTKEESNPLDTGPSLADQGGSPYKTLGQKAWDFAEKPIPEMIPEQGLLGGLIQRPSTLMNKLVDTANTLPQQAVDAGINPTVAKVGSFPLQFEAGMTRSIGSGLESAVTPLNLAILGALPLASGIAPFAAAGFGAQQGVSALQDLAKAYQNFKAGNISGGAENLGSATVSGGLGFAGGRGAVEGMGEGARINEELNAAKTKMAQEQMPLETPKAPVIQRELPPAEIPPDQFSSGGEQVTQNPFTPPPPEPKPNFNAPKGNDFYSEGEVPNIHPQEVGPTNPSPFKPGPVPEVEGETPALSPENIAALQEQRSPQVAEQTIEPTKPEEVEKAAEQPNPDKLAEATASITPETMKQIKEKQQNQLEASTKDKSGILGLGKSAVSGLWDYAQNQLASMTSMFRTNGANLVHESKEGATSQSLLEQHHYQMFDDAVKALKEGKGDIQSSWDRIGHALEDRGNADKYLNTKSEKTAYGLVRHIFDNYKEILDARGIHTLKDYMTHMHDFVANVEDFEAQGNRKEIPKEIVSDMMKERKGNKNYSYNLGEIVPKYIASMTRALSYDRVAKFYHEQFLPEAIKNGASKEQLKVGQKYMNDLLASNGRNPNPNFRTLNKIGEAAIKVQYAPIKFSPKIAALHFLQKNLARMYTSSEGRSFGNMLLHMDDEKIQGFLEHGNVEKDVRKVIEKNPFKSGIDINAPLTGVMNKITPEVRAWGLGEALSKSEMFKDLKAKGMGTVEAMHRVLSDDPSFKAASRASEALKNRVLFDPSKALKPEGFKNMNWITREAMMFKQFAVRSTVTASEAVFARMGTRARDIMEQGTSPNASIAETYTASKQLQDAANAALKDNPTDVNLRQAKQVIDNSVREHGNLIKQLHSVNPAKSVAVLGALTIAGGLVRHTWQAIGNVARRKLGLPEQRENSILKDIWKSSPPGEIVSGLQSMFGSPSDYSSKKALARKGIETATSIPDALLWKIPSEIIEKKLHIDRQRQ